MRESTASLLARTATGWLVALVMAFPILWMALTAFKTELDAVSPTPLLFFTPTLENFAEMQQRVDYLAHAWNSIVVALGSTILALLIATPAAYSMAFFPTRRVRGILLWMLSTKFMPAVGVLVPIYLLLVGAGLLDTRTGLLLIMLLSNLPLVVWMLYSYFKEIPFEIVEMARVDGALPLQQLRFLLLPLAASGMASAALLAIILSWNESFWCINVTAVNAGTLAVAIASFSNPEGFFWAKLSAASLASVAPIMVFGWLVQRQLARAITFGALN